MPPFNRYLLGPNHRKVLAGQGNTEYLLCAERRARKEEVIKEAEAQSKKRERWGREAPEERRQGEGCSWKKD